MNIIENFSTLKVLKILKSLAVIIERNSLIFKCKTIIMQCLSMKEISVFIFTPAFSQWA